MAESDLEVLLVGSVPLSSSSETFKTLTQTLPGQLKRIPDGETGSRLNFVGFQQPVFPANILKPQFTGQPPSKEAGLKYTAADLKPTDYDTYALESFSIFRNLQESRTIPSDLRFQVCLPSPLTAVRGFVATEYCAQIDPLYEEKLLEAVRHIQDEIPASQLCIQWDLPCEPAFIEFEQGRLDDPWFTPYFTNVKTGILDRVARLASAVDVDVELGFHLCYGDIGHQHYIQPEDSAILVDLANDIQQKVAPIHEIAYLHMPVPKDRTDEAYFAPLKNLRLGSSTKLFLGLIHPNDEAGTQKRADLAKAAYSKPFGVASECGLGRTPREDLDSILAVAKSIT